MRQISNNFLTKAFVSLLTYTASTLFLFSSSVQAQIKLSPFVIETETQNEIKVVRPLKLDLDAIL